VIFRKTASCQARCARKPNAKTESGDGYNCALAHQIKNQRGRFCRAATEMGTPLLTSTSICAFSESKLPGVCFSRVRGAIAVQDRKVWEERVRAEHLCERVHCDDALAASERIASL
jgi:hypothetical protein